MEPELFEKQTFKTLRQREAARFQQNMWPCRTKFACFWSQFSRLENWVHLILPVLFCQQRPQRSLTTQVYVLVRKRCVPRSWFQNSALCCKSTLMFTVCFVSVKQTATVIQHLTSLTESRRHGNFVLLSFGGAFQLCEKQKKSGLQTKSLYGSLNSLSVEDWSVMFVLCSLTSLPERNFEVTTFWSVNVKNFVFVASVRSARPLRLVRVW